MQREDATPALSPASSVLLGPETPIVGAPGLTIGAFWAWAYSDVLSNRNRAILAEFLVGAALGTLTGPRVEWDAVDHRYRDHGIEVKASGFLQAWVQRVHSTVRFAVAAKRPDNGLSREPAAPSRVADYFVFCLFTPLEVARAEVLDLGNWDFFVVPTSDLPVQGSIGLAQLRSLATPVLHGELRARLDALIDQPADLARSSWVSS